MNIKYHEIFSPPTLMSVYDSAPPSYEASKDIVHSSAVPSSQSCTNQTSEFRDDFYASLPKKKTLDSSLTLVASRVSRPRKKALVCGIADSDYPNPKLWFKAIQILDPEKEYDWTLDFNNHVNVRFSDYDKKIYYDCLGQNSTRFNLSNFNQVLCVSNKLPNRDVLNAKGTDFTKADVDRAIFESSSFFYEKDHPTVYLYGGHAFNVYEMFESRRKDLKINGGSITFYYEGDPYTPTSIPGSFNSRRLETCKYRFDCSDETVISSIEKIEDILKK